MTSQSTSVHALAKDNLRRLINPASVAVIGASDDPFRIGGRPIAYMLDQGYAGTIFPVNPGRETVQGLKAYPSVDALPHAPDAAIVAVAAAKAVDVVRQLAERGCGAAIMFSAGFAESGPEGAAQQDEMVRAARQYGMRLLGPNSLGVISPRNGFYGSFCSGMELGFPESGRVGIASQSGAYGAHITCLARKRGIGLSTCVMTGNEADISLGDVIQILVDDPATDVIAVYSEGIREADGFVAALAAARAARKPVVMMKVGTSAVGSAAAQSHTASIAGDDAVTDAVLAEFGVVRAHSTENMLDIAALATRGIFPEDNSLGVITVSGGAGVIISDAADRNGLPMPEMPEETQKRLKEILPFASPRNPVDCTAQFLNDFTLAGRFTEAMIEEGGYRSILGFFTYTGAIGSIGPKLREQLKQVRDKYPDRLYVMSIMADPDIVRQYEADGFSIYEDPSRAVSAIAAMGRFGKSFAYRPGLPAPILDAITLPAKSPSEAQAKQILAKAGIATTPEHACATVQDAVDAAQSLGYPVVLKILSPDILHKSEIGGVLLNVTSDAQVREGFSLLLERAAKAVPQAHIEGVLVAKQISGGVECILGIHRDPVFGPVAMFGLGGIFVEILKDVTFHRCPFGVDVAESMIRSVKGAPLLLGARGKPPVDIAALAEMLSRLSALAVAAGPRLQSIDLNPVFALPEGKGVFAADAVIEVLAE